MTALTWADTADGVGEVRRADGEPVARYSWLRANHPYFDELRPLTHDGVLTAHAPHDHRWHHGLWWSWKFLNDVLFWEDHPDYGGNRIGLGRSVVVAHEVSQEGDAVVIDERLDWRVDASGEVLLIENRSIRVAADHGFPNVWTLDWDQEWTATTDVRLEVTPWPETTWGGYAGLNYRAARAMVAEETILGDGAEGVAALHGTPSAWAAYTGLVDGAENDEPNRPAAGGVALLQHPGNPQHPDPVYTFSASGEFGFLATAPLMREPRTLGSGQTLRLRTRVAVLGAVAEADTIRSLYAAYAADVAADA